MGYYVNLLLIYALVVESFIDGVVLYMFCFFFRADDPIKISRWVTKCNITMKLLYNLPYICVIIVMVCLWVFSQEEEEQKRLKRAKNGGQWPKNPQVMANGFSE